MGESLNNAINMIFIYLCVGIGSLYVFYWIIVYFMGTLEIVKRGIEWIKSLLNP